ncbi:MAG: TolC family protein [Ignavibacteriales bacterium]|nr:TolC family protein [Ignavibacteriales bacterium]
MAKTEIAAALFLVSSVVLAGESLTIDKSVAMALERNHSIRSAAYSVEAARWGRLNSYTNFLPKAEVTASYTQVDQQTYDRANASIDFIRAAAGSLGIPPALLSNIKPFVYKEQYATDVTIIQPLYNGGAEIVGFKAAGALLDKNNASYQDVEQDVITRAKTAYYAVLKAEEVAALAKESLERTVRYLETTKRRAGLGSRTETDILRWEVQRAADEGNLIAAQNYEAMARLQLNDVLGVEMPAEYSLEKTIVSDSSFVFLPENAPGGRIPFSMLTLHPSMQVMESNLRLADLNVSQSYINFQPRVNLAFQYGWEKNNTLSLDGIRPWAFSLQVSIPVFNSFGDYTNLQKAQAEFESTQEKVLLFKSGLVLQATSARWAVATARKRGEAAYKGLHVAQEVLTAVTRRYEMGGASSIDVLDVTTAYTAARTSYVGAVYDYLTAEAQLARALGTVKQIQ